MTVLMYHSVSPVDSEARSPYFQTNTRPETFRYHMAYLAENGYRVVPLSDLVGKEFLEGRIQSKTVVITFDDGYKDFLEYAFPVLDEFGFPATQFIATGLVGKVFNGRPCLDWEDIRALSGKNVAFGSHTATHPKLHAMPDIEIAKEVATSKNEIEANLGETISTFAYPYAFPQEDSAFTSRLESILKNTGIKIGVTTRIGRHRRSENPFSIRRIPVNMHDDPLFFGTKLDGGYDWLSIFQLASRTLFAPRHKKGLA